MKFIIKIILIVAGISIIVGTIFYWRKQMLENQAEDEMGVILYSVLDESQGLYDKWQVIDNHIYQMDYQTKRGEVVITLPEQIGGAESLVYGKNENEIYCLCWKDADEYSYLTSSDERRKRCSIVLCDLKSKNCETILSAEQLGDLLGCEETEVNISDLSYLSSQDAIVFVRNYREMYQYRMNEQTIEMLYKSPDYDIKSYQWLKKNKDELYIIDSSNYWTPAESTGNRLIKYNIDTKESVSLVEQSQEPVSFTILSADEKSIVFTADYSAYQMNLDGLSVETIPTEHVERVFKASDSGKYVLGDCERTYLGGQFSGYDVFILNVETGEKVYLDESETLWKVCR